MKRGCLIVGTVVSLFLLISLSSLIYVLFRYDAPGLARGTYLEIGIAGSLPDYNPVNPFLGDAPLSMRELLDILKYAKNEDRVAGIVVRIAPMGIGWGKTTEIRDAILSVKESGKEVLAFIEMGGDKEYYLATAADEIVVPPLGGAHIDGIDLQTQFFRGTLDKVGVIYDGVAVGKYKSAPEHYKRSSMSTPYLEETHALADGLYNTYVGAVARARGMTARQVKDFIDKAPLDAIDIKKAGLIDHVLYWDEFVAWVESKGKDKKAPITAASRIRDKAARAQRKTFSRDKVAVLYVQGTIVSGLSASGWNGNSTGDVTVARALRQIREDSRIRALVIRVNSPGGSVLASDNMWREIQLTRQEMPVVVSMGDMAASGGYYIAVAADAIVAEPQTLTGSIGIFTGKFVLAELYDKVGVTIDGTKRGAHADLYSNTRVWNAEERRRLESQLAELYDVFVRKVAAGRQMEVEQAERLAQGRVWLGIDAYSRGLVDELGGLDRAVELACDRANIDVEKVGIAVFPRQRAFFESLTGWPWVRAQIAKGIPEPLRDLAASQPVRFADGEPLALMPVMIQAD